MWEIKNMSGHFLAQLDISNLFNKIIILRRKIVLFQSILVFLPDLHPIWEFIS